MKQTYIRCPRCELNYILKKDKFCKVCKTEMKALGTLGAEENLDLELCPICKVNYINPDEDICPQCAKEKENEDGENISSNKFAGEWESYNNQEEDDESSYQTEENGEMVSISSLEDTPLTDDEMDLDISDEDDETGEDEEGEENLNEDDDFDIDDETFDDEDDDDEDEEDDGYDDENEKSKKRNKR